MLLWGDVLVGLDEETLVLDVFTLYMLYRVIKKSFVARRHSNYKRWLFLHMEGQWIWKCFANFWQHWTLTSKLFLHVEGLYNSKKTRWNLVFANLKILFKKILECRLCIWVWNGEIQPLFLMMRLLISRISFCFWGWKGLYIKWEWNIKCWKLFILLHLNSFTLDDLLSQCYFCYQEMDGC
jgi:hypothetical protein